MSWHKIRPFIDILMGLMLILEMFYMFTGNLLHEVIGVLFFATLIIHIVLSRSWLKGISIKVQSGQKLSFKNKARVGIMAVLVVAFLILLVSSVLISNVLGETIGWMLTGSPYSILAFIHTVCAYLVCITVICHVGFHWVGLFKSLKIPYNPQRRQVINAGVTSVASIGVVALAISATKEIALWNGFVSEAESLAESEIESQSDSSRELRTENNGKPYVEGDRELRAGRYHEYETDAYGFPEESADDNTPYSGGTPYGDGQSQDSSMSQDESGSNSGICTLCRKQCSLSAPKCNKPYTAGL